MGYKIVHKTIAKMDAKPTGSAMGKIDMRLKGKRAIVTGGAAGIGAAIAGRFVAEGASVLIADKNLEAAKSTAGQLGGRAAGVLAVPVDVASSSSVQRMVQTCVSELGGLDILVNNAGIVHRGDSEIDTTTEDAWDATLAVNLKGVFLSSKFAVPAILAGGNGSIVNIASVVALLGSYPAQVAYTASKGGVIALSREMAVGLARKGIRVNAICPGPITTDMAAGLIQDDAAFQHRRQHIPLGRMGDPKEIAATAAFLASDDASYITGQAFSVDGGMNGAYLTPPDR